MNFKKTNKIEPQNPYLKKRPFSYETEIRFPIVSSLRREEDKIISAVFQKVVRSDDSIIEIGSGTGYYTEKLIKLSEKILCIEPAPVMIREYQKRFSKINKTAPVIIQGSFPQVIPERKFDHVIAIGVLDFFPDINGFLTKALDLAEKCLIFTTVEQYALGKVGLEIATLFGSRVYLHGEEEIRRLLIPLNVEIYRANPRRVFAAATLICLVKKDVNLE